MLGVQQISDNEAQKIVAYYQKGNTLEASAKKFSRAYTTVQKLVKSAGVSRKRGRVAS